MVAKRRRWIGELGHDSVTGAGAVAFLLKARPGSRLLATVASRTIPAFPPPEEQPCPHAVTLPTPFVLYRWMRCKRPIPGTRALQWAWRTSLRSCGATYLS